MKLNLKQYLWPISVFVTTFALYCLTLPLTNVGYGDSDMLIAVGYGGGVAHPPGYPLYVLLTWIFTHLSLSLPLAAKAHLLSALLSALTLTILFLSVRNILRSIKRCSDPISNLVSLISVFSLAIMFPYWLYSIITEKYALNLLLASLIIYLSTKLIIFPRPRRVSLWLILFFILGLALTTHLTLWFLLPMVLITLYYRRPKLKYLLAALAGLALPLLLLWYLNLRSTPPLSWHFPANLNGLLNHATMQAYFTHDPEPRPLSPALFVSLLKYPQYLVLSYGLIPLILAIYGLILIIKKPHSPLKNLLLMGVFFTLVLLPFIIKWPSLYSGQATVQRQYLIGYLFLPLLFTLGLNEILLQIKKRSLRLVLLTLVSLSLILRLFIIYPQIKLKSDTQFSEFYRQVLSGLPEKAQLFCFSDVSCFALLYEQTINHSRPDVTIIPEAYQLLSQPLPNLTPDFINQNLAHSPIHLLDLPQKYYDLLDFDYGAFYLVPHDLTAQVSTISSSSASLSTHPYSQFLLTTNYAPTDPVRLQRLAGAAQRHLVNAMTARIRHDEVSYLNEATLAQKLSAKLGEPYLGSIQTVLKLYSENPYPKYLYDKEK